MKTDSLVGVWVVGIDIEALCRSQVGRDTGRRAGSRNGDEEQKDGPPKGPEIADPEPNAGELKNANRQLGFRDPVIARKGDYCRAESYNLQVDTYLGI